MSVFGEGEQQTIGARYKWVLEERSFIGVESYRSERGVEYREHRAIEIVRHSESVDNVVCRS
jgi:hypothetical protein